MIAVRLSMLVVRPVGSQVGFRSVKIIPLASADVGQCGRDLSADGVGVGGRQVRVDPALAGQQRWLP